MRRGCSDTAIFVGEDGVFQGVSLGWDFTSEHEWGIKVIARDYGLRDVSRGDLLSGILKNDVLGIEARKIQRIPEYLELIVKGDVTYIISKQRWSNEDKSPTKKELDRSMEAFTTYDGDIQGAWDEGSFGVRVAGKENRKHLKELFEAFNNNDVIITRGSAIPGNPFSGSGLMLLIASRLPQEYIDEAAASDIDRLDLMDASEKTGITERLKKAKLRYFALSPKWAGEIESTPNEKIKTKHPVIFWLNPCEQDRNNFGWFTVETLDQWIAGKGLVPKEAA